MGPAIGAAIAVGLGAPPLVIFAAVVTGAAGATFGGPAGAYLAALISTEIGKMVSKETKVDIIVTPFVTILTGFAVAKFVGAPISKFMTMFGSWIMWGTEQKANTHGNSCRDINGTCANSTDFECCNRLHA